MALHWPGAMHSTQLPLPSQTPPPVHPIPDPFGGKAQVPALQVLPRQSFGGVQLDASRQATQVPFPVQKGVAAGHALSVCV